MLAPFEEPLAVLAACAAELLTSPQIRAEVIAQMVFEQHREHGICQWCNPNYWAIIETRRE